MKPKKKVDCIRGRFTVSDIYSDTSSSGSEVNVSTVNSPVRQCLPHPHPAVPDTVTGMQHGEHPQTMLEAYKGQLKVAVYINYGLLTVHVVQAKQLRSKSVETCDPFVKLSLVPDESERTSCQTEVVPESNAPMFDEKFSFELLEEDLKRRLLISVWHHSASSGCDEFLGCMSFGIKKISKENKNISGWYFLLPEEVGKNRHLLAPERKQNLTERSSNIPQINQDLLWMDTHILVIKRGGRSYGFTVTGQCPVLVSRTEPGGPADQAGLLKDDCIVRINGLNVSRSTSDSVARIIRHSEKQIVLEVQRPQVMLGCPLSQPQSVPTPAAPQATEQKHEKPTESTKATQPPHKKSLKRFGSLKLLLWNSKDKENKESAKSKALSQIKEMGSKVKAFAKDKDKENKDSTKAKLSSGGGSNTSLLAKNTGGSLNMSSLKKGTFSSSTLPRNFGKKIQQQSQPKPNFCVYHDTPQAYPSSWLDVDQSQLYKSSSSCSSSSSVGAWSDHSRNYGYRFQQWDFGPQDSTHISEVEPTKKRDPNAPRKRVSFRLSPSPRRLSRIIEQPTLQDLPELEPGMTWV